MNRKSSRHLMPRSGAPRGHLTINRASARLLAVAGFAAGALALGAVAVGAAAFGAAAFGAVAIGRLAVGRARLRSVEIAELRVGRLSVGELINDRGPQAVEPAGRPVERRIHPR